MRYVYLAAAILAITGCSNYVANVREASHGQTREWAEVVRTLTGHEFTVRRGERRRFAAMPFTKGSWQFEEGWIECDLPKGGHLRWDTSLSPWLLDQAEDGTWYLVGADMTWRSLHEYGLFNPRGWHKHFAAYKLSGRSWQRIIASELPPEFTRPNLLVFSDFVFEERERTIYDFNSYRTLPAETPIADGGTVTLGRKARVNFPYHEDRPVQTYFKVFIEDFDDGLRYLPCGQVQCEPVQMGHDSNFGRAPVIVSPRD